MSQNSPFSTLSLSDSYTPAFRRDAHQLLAWGYEDARNNISSGQEETEITGFIAEAIRNRFDDLRTPERFNRYSLSEDSPISDENLTGKSRNRVDIIIESSSNKPRPKYVFEAKRLFTGSHPIGKYTNTEGLQRFVNGKYASQYPEAAMIAYMQNKDIDYWQSELKDNFSSNQNLQIISSLNPAIVISSLPNEWSSKHRRTNNSTIVIYHIFLDCR